MRRWWEVWRHGCPTVCSPLPTHVLLSWRLDRKKTFLKKKNTIFFSFFFFHQALDYWCLFSFVRSLKAIVELDNLMSLSSPLLLSLSWHSKFEPFFFLPFLIHFFLSNNYSICVVQCSKRQQQGKEQKGQILTTRGKEKKKWTGKEVTSLLVR